MLPPLEIFKLQEGTYVWKAPADSLEHAKAKIKELAAKSPGEYMIFSQTTGNKLVVKPDGSPEPKAA
jgi:hypothetical protein